MSLRAALFLLFLSVALIGPLIAPYDAYATSAERVLRPPDLQYAMGTDALGRDILSRVLVGGQRTITQALLATALAVGLGVIGGAIALAGPGPTAAVVRAAAAALLAVPQVVWSLALLTLLGSGPAALVLALGLPLAPLMVTVSRAALERAQVLPYVTAAQAIGATNLRIVRSHLIPASWPTLTRYASILFAYAILNAAGLAFLGFSAPGEPEWGAMLAEARLTLRASPWPAIFSGLLITGLVWTALALSRLRAMSGRD